MSEDDPTLPGNYILQTKSFQIENGINHPPEVLGFKNPMVTSFHFELDIFVGTIYRFPSCSNFWQKLAWFYGPKTWADLGN